MKSFHFSTSLALIASLSNEVSLDSTHYDQLAQLGEVPVPLGYETREGSAGTSTETYIFTPAANLSEEPTCVRKTEYSMFNDDEEYDPSTIVQTDPLPIETCCEWAKRKPQANGDPDPDLI